MPITVKSLSRNKGRSKGSHLHCRLCAVLKPCVGLLDLKANEDRRKSILDQLSRLSICVSNLESEDDILPQTICSACISSLDKAFNFALNVEKAQAVLNKHIWVCCTKEHDYSKSLKHSKDFPSIAVHNNINKVVLDKSKNNLTISQPFQTTESCNINELQFGTKLSTDTSIQIEMNDFKEEFKISVTDYQIIGHSQLKPSKAIYNSNYDGDVIDLTEVEAKRDATPGICFDFEEENIDENLETEDNCYEILRTETNLACSANEVENREKTLMDIVIEIDEELSDDENDDTLLMERIDLNQSERYIENLVENVAKIDSVMNIKENKVNSYQSYEMQNQEETTSEDEAQNEEFELSKECMFNNFIRGIPFVVLNKISDADLVALRSRKFCIES